MSTYIIGGMRLEELCLGYCVCSRMEDDYGVSGVHCSGILRSSMYGVELAYYQNGRVADKSDGAELLIPSGGFIITLGIVEGVLVIAVFSWPPNSFSDRVNLHPRRRMMLCPSETIRSQPTNRSSICAEILRVFIRCG